MQNLSRLDVAPCNQRVENVKTICQSGHGNAHGDVSCVLVFLVLRQDRREVVHFNVTEFPCAAWVAQQMCGAFPFDTAPRFLIRDGDRIYGEVVREVSAA